MPNKHFYRFLLNFVVIIFTAMTVATLANKYSNF